jgi:hypothetical protein
VKFAVDEIFWPLMSPSVETPALSVVANRLVDDAVVEKRFVVVAEVPVALVKVSVWSAVVLVAVKLPTAKIEVVAFEVVAVVAVSAPTLILLAISEVIFASVEVKVLMTPVVNLPTDAKKLVVVADVPVALLNMMLFTFKSPEISALPATESFCDGDVVPRPRFPEELITLESAPVVLYISSIFAVCPLNGTSANVVVAVDPEITESFAYDVVVAPIPTTSVVVESVTLPILFVSQPPALETPETLRVPQFTFPFTSVWRA